MYWGRVGPSSNMTGVHIKTEGMQRRRDIGRKWLCDDGGRDCNNVSSSQSLLASTRHWKRQGRILCWRFQRPCGSMVKNPPSVQEMQETQVWSLGWEYPLEKEMATHFSILAWKILISRSLAHCKPWGCKKSDTTYQLSHHQALRMQW